MTLEMGFNEMPLGATKCVVQPAKLRNSYCIKRKSYAYVNTCFRVYFGYRYWRGVAFRSIHDALHRIEEGICSYDVVGRCDLDGHKPCSDDSLAAFVIVSATPSAVDLTVVSHTCTRVKIAGFGEAAHVDLPARLHRVYRPLESTES